MKHPFRLAWIAAFAVLAGCGGLLKSGAPSEQVYVLRPAAAEGPAATPVAGVLAVPRPVVQPGLASTRIALTRPGNRLDYFAGASWSASLPQVVGALATESLRAAGRFEVVTDAERGGNPRYALQLMVRHFEAEYPDDGTASPRARVEFECLLVASVSRDVLGHCDAQAIVPATANRMGAIVQALEQAARQAMAEVIDRAAEAAARSASG
ncbi:MAG: ABC-type transport auxiliary lipoprotein family protein [Steroidobacteraceae bacterium]